MNNYHIPVLLEESVSALALKEGGKYADVTFGGGGHSRLILERLKPNSTLIAMDRDADALNNAPKDPRLILVHNNFRFLANYVEYYKLGGLDGVLADLGVSSHQFDTQERGFSFRFDSKLDMRMNQLAPNTAADILNSYSIEDLRRILKTYGEVENSKRVASLICKEREFNSIRTTYELNNLLKPILPKFGDHKYLAKIYQALRIEVNGEMKDLENFLTSSLKVLNSGARVVIITYHSLEDRIVKNFLKSGNIEGEINRDLYGNFDTPFDIINRKPIIPSEQEISINTRSRSAKLRVAQKK
jgi:16S rRNA (cytosine1402-N4)-methyltransferase